MAIYDSTRTLPAASGLRPGQLLARLHGALSDWNDHRVTRASLSRLTAHELADIGLDHADIDVVADGRRR
ncbi:hypothetical protein OG2516_07707 [Oceanicola granulosus HTCC2516]|uniref:YjiS-like domain-containing protein n=1 Tax=Oceanicola granulosus (strain ATCC BAA-861 / DSM 15982 / KCTC 12143 / HTCC2516) TaxID=314256 RepID=Q2CIB3_OCEGH|nr:DUF1127 domain-containing protein [Oceanicola granulosus]EAR52345.1 hypothetical protein OG2516_07707 [Oceanicola granulosus HTCC2516]